MKYHKHLFNVQTNLLMLTMEVPGCPYNLMVFINFRLMIRFTECLSMTFGDECKNQCRCNVNNTRACGKETGECFCKDGWKGATCDEDIPECTRTPGICGVHSLCTEMPGSYRCTCEDGYTMSSNHDCQSECLNASLKLSYIQR